MDILSYILAGAGVGFAVGLTGVGGGSLMTPMLLLFGFPPHIAVGTDLVYAGVTKSGGVFMHHRRGTIDWKIVGAMAAGSLPATAATIVALKLYFDEGADYTELLTFSLGLMLILTATVLLFRNKIRSLHTDPEATPSWFRRHARLVTFFMGIILGVLVTLSSVGAGALGTAILLVLFPLMSSRGIVGTDLAHAVPLTLVAGIGHIFLGNVDFMLLGCLLTGSLPAIYFGTRVGARLPDKILHPLLASTLFAIGLKYTFF